MTSVTKNELLDTLAQYGYVLSKPVLPQDPEKLMEDLLRQNDVRLLEGFPVVLFNAMKEKSPMKWEKNNWLPSEALSKGTANRMASMLALSYLLFQLYGLESGYLNRVSRLLEKFSGGTEVLKEVEPYFSKSETVPAGDLRLSSDRLKGAFRLYMLNAADHREVELKKKELQLELLLSALFSPKQKELMKKRLAGKKFTKTEREYYSRVVKKKLKALASSELHQLALNLFNA